MIEHHFYRHELMRYPQDFINTQQLPFVLHRGDNLYDMQGINGVVQRTEVCGHPRHEPYIRVYVQLVA